MFSKSFSLRSKTQQGGQPQSHGSLHSLSPGESHQRHASDSRPDRSPSTHSNQADMSASMANESGPGPLGLNVVYSPETERKVDIVFIHGLGGSSRWTWSKNKHPDLFWPLTFLPLESVLCRARILSFGYNANFRKSGNASTVVLDFAKELLFDLKFAKDERNEDLRMGSVPLLFVVHSMGGLIAKEAYMQGLNDPGYKKIIEAISAILFLATPHRGTNLAEILNRVLQTTLVSTPKKYISELSKDSFTLQKLNEQFRHVAPKLDIVSFYETQPTSIGLKGARVMILEKDSSVLGYPGETSKAISADHHNICKYESPLDPNYITVRNVLKSIVDKTILATQISQTDGSDRRKSIDLKSILAIPELPDVDYIFFKDQWTQGTNLWFLKERAYQEWVNPHRSTSDVLWVSGGAGTGKSVLSSFIIDELIQQGRACQYFYIRYGDRKKRTLSLLLRSIAYQITQRIPEFYERISGLIDEAFDLESADPKTIWERIFKSVLFKIERDDPLFWVIDGLDESIDARATIKLFSDISLSNFPIRIILLGRVTAEITTALRKLPPKVCQAQIGIEGHQGDIYAHIEQELSMSGSADLRAEVVQRLVEGAQRNFLWLRLAVERLNSCHTFSDVDRAFHELPRGMEALYGRMATSIAQNPSSSGRELALTILQCVTCSSRVLTVAELSQALNKDHSDMLDLQQSIGELCGGFVVVDNSGKVSMLHHSAREYLLDVEDGPFVVNRDAAHEQLFLSCMRCLMSTGIRARITRNEIPDFLEYSATWWSSHLALITTSNESVQTIVSKFLTSHWVLVWIHALVVTKKLRILIRSAKCLSKYATERQKMGVEAFSEVNHMVEHQFLESWAVDFVKIAGRFATNLRRNPEAIYKLIPPFCPHNSAIYQQFGKSEHRSLAVLGLSTQNWDDSIARLSFGIGTNASSILAAGAQIAVLAPPGNVFVYNSSDFEEAATSPIRHGERVYRMAMNGSGSLLVTYGFKSVKVWETSTAACKLSVANLESRPRPLAIIFVKNDSLLLVGSDDRKIRSLDLYDPAPTWHIIAELDEPQLEGHFLNASSYMAINNEGSLIAVAYRGHPLSAWEIDGPIHIDHCWRARGQVARGEVMEAVWHPHSPQLLGLYIEGVVFKWDPYEGNLEEIGTGATTLAISRDGNLFATGDVHGTIKVYTTSEFRLLYQLASQDAVIDLEFSPNIHRLYDVRGDYGTAWEPNALMRYEERLERSLDGDGDSASFGQSSTVSMGASRRVDSVTSLAGSPLGRLYCSGTEYGAVQLFDLQQGKLCDIQDSTLFLGIEQMTWSPNGRCIAFSDSSQNIFIASISPEMAGCEVERLVERSMEDDTSGPITQLLFHPDSSHLLVSTPSTVHLISSESAAVKYHLQGLRDSCKWIIHPQDKSHIVGVGPNSVTICDWNLNQKATYSIQFQSTEDLSSTFEPSPRTGEIDHVRVTQDKRHIFVQMSADNGLKDKMFFHFGTSLISTVPVSVSEGPMNITASVLPKTFGSRISSCLAFLSHDRLVFLSKGHSICWSKISFGTDQDRPSQPSRHLSSISSSSSDASSPWPHHQIFKGGFQQLEDQTNEIFSVPGDWISRDCLALCTIWTSENALLCPRNGEIAVVKSVGLA